MLIFIIHHHGVCKPCVLSVRTLLATAGDDSTNSQLSPHAPPPPPATLCRHHMRLRSDL